MSYEWYFLAGRDFPEEERYDGYLQLENGVGMMRLLINEFDEALSNVKPSINEKSIEQYIEWNKNFGSFQFEDKDE